VPVELSVYFWSTEKGLSLPLKQDIEVYQGEDFYFEFAPLQDDLCVGIDLSAYSAEIEARLHPRDPDVEFAITNITLGSNGVISIEMTNAETDPLEEYRYYYDVKLEAPSGDISYPYAGIIFVEPSITEP
jgi:hypothetical protein